MRSSRKQGPILHNQKNTTALPHHPQHISQMTPRMTNSLEAYQYIQAHLRFDKEVFWILGLDLEQHIVCHEHLFSGTLGRCPIYPREVFRFALKNNVAHVVLVHTHTTPCVQPSPADLQITKKLIQLGTVLDVHITDHLIIHKERCFSFLDHKLL